MVKKTPDRLSAIHAVSVASNLVREARENYRRGDFMEAISTSKNAMRIASSAVLFRDGYISSTFEDTVLYLSRKYPGRFPLEKWKETESPSIAGRFKSIIGGRKLLEKEAGEAVETADKFVNQARVFLDIRE